MAIISTDIRVTRESAHAIRYYPTLPITATNVQDAIRQDITLPKTVVTTAVTAAMSPYTPTNSDAYLMVNTTGGAVQILMQAAAARAGLPLTIKDANGNSDVNAITVTPSGAETVDGLAPYLIDSKFSAVRFAPKTGGYFVDS